MRVLTFVVVTILPAFAQQTTRTFHVPAEPSAPVVSEVATILRTVAGVKDISTDPTKMEINIVATEAELATCQWIIDHLKRQQALPADFHVPGSEDVVHVAYPANLTNQAELWEIVTNLRANCDLQRIFFYTLSNAIFFRQSQQRVDMGTWLINQLDLKPDDPHRFDAHEYPAPGKPNELLKVMFLHQPSPNKGLNELVTTLRVVADVQRIFTHSGEPRGIAFYGDLPHVRTAEWLVQQLDIQPDNAIRAAQHALPVPFSPGETARVYFLNGQPPLNDIVTAIRSEVDARRIFVYTPPVAFALRGDPEVIAVADRVVSKYNPPPGQ